MNVRASRALVNWRGSLALVVALVTCAPAPQRSAVRERPATAQAPSARPTAALAAPPGPPSSGSAPAAPPDASPPPPDTTFTLDGKTYTLGKDHPFPACHDPIGWLAYYRFEELPARFCRRCNRSCEGEPMPWRFLANMEHPENGDCNVIEYVRLALGVRFDLRVKSPRFVGYFARQAGEKRASRTEKDLPEQAQKNLAVLDAALARCRASTSSPGPRRTELVDRWFRDKARGTLRLPKQVLAGCQPLDRAEAVAILNSDTFRLTPVAPISIGALPCSEGVGTAVTVRMVTADEVNCIGDDESCGAYGGITFVLDEHERIVALDLNLAACPAVYVDEGGAPRRLVGEILRHQLGPNREATQALALRGARCDRPIRILIAEEKPETTHLDAVWLSVDGRRVEPAACSRSRPSYCETDGDREPLRFGEELTLEFHPSPGASCRDVRLHAHGYYETHPLRRR